MKRDWRYAIRQSRRAAATALLLVLISVPAALADMAATDPREACDRAATAAETRWHLPAGLLAGIGTVESGRAAPGSRLPVAWPWSINFGGRGMFLPSKDAAVATVRALQAAGWRAIDVGCFQVDLFYHPTAFANLDDAFDPATNAESAAKILMNARFRSANWDGAVALYHSADPLLGTGYLRRVLTAWSWAKARVIPPATSEAYIALLSPSARLVRIIGPSDWVNPGTRDLPQLRGPQDSSGVVQWAGSPRALPVVLTPEPPAASPGRHVREVN